MFLPTTPEERLDYIQERIQKAAISAGRKSKHITIVAITKSFPAQIWEQAMNLNLKTLGESRIQEAREKLQKFKKRDKIELHFIGHLQSNKARRAIELFDVIQTIDSKKLARKINYICGESDKKQNIYLQVNTGADPNKHGVSIKNAISAAREITKMENLTLNGIMTITPQNTSEKELSYIYKKTRLIRDEIREKVNRNCYNVSMGMSNDYEIAIAEGATHVRIGAGIFGDRPK